MINQVTKMRRPDGTTFDVDEDAAQVAVSPIQMLDFAAHCPHCDRQCRVAFETPPAECACPYCGWQSMTLTQLHAQESAKIDHPAYYGGKDDPYEAIKVIEAWGLGFCLGNTIKYISRAGKKSRSTLIEDLEKARWYLTREIDRLKASKSQP